MRPMRADRTLDLEEEFVGRIGSRVVGAPVLAADLTELARPVRQDERPSAIDEQGIVSVFRSVVARPGEPSPRELIVARDEESGGIAAAGRLIATAPDPF